MYLLYDTSLVAIKYNVSNNCVYVNVDWVLIVDTINKSTILVCIQNKNKDMNCWFW